MKNKLNYETKDRLVGIAFILPWIIGFLSLTLYPIIYSVILSVSNVQLYPGKIVLDFAGLKYYNYAWNVDTDFRLDVGQAVILICCATPVIVVFSLIIALLLNSKFFGRTFLRAVYFLPVIVMSGPAISGLLTDYTVDFSAKNPEIFSLINALPGVIKSPLVYILDNLVLILWFSGVEIIVFLAGLQKISPSLYEAASIDGAGAWEKFWKITLPHIAPIAMVCAIYAIVDISNYSELSINGRISSHLFDTNSMYSFSAAMSWIYFAILLVMLLAVFVIFNLVKSRRDR